MSREPDGDAVRNLPERTREEGLVDRKVIPVAEEEVRIGKREIVTGRVRVRTQVETVRESVSATLEEEIVEVSRVPVDKIIEEAPAIREEDGVTIVPVVQEVLVVEKRLVLKEEIHIRRRRQSETFETPVELRKERVVVERLPADEAADPRLK